MNILKLSVLTVILGSTCALADDCTAPATPKLPDGSTSSMQEMLEGQKAVKTFQAANLEYMKCLEPVMASAKDAAASAVEKGDKTADDEAVKAYQAAQDAYNAAVSAEEELAGQFNAAVRDYKAANPAK